MRDDYLSTDETIELGLKLEALCEQLSPRQQEFVRMALGVAAADLWAHTNESAKDRSILDLVIDIQTASAAGTISLNPLPIPRAPEGPSA